MLREACSCFSSKWCTRSDGCILPTVTGSCSAGPTPSETLMQNILLLSEIFSSLAFTTLMLAHVEDNT